METNQNKEMNPFTLKPKAPTDGVFSRESFDRAAQEIAGQQPLVATDELAKLTEGSATVDISEQFNPSLDPDRATDPTFTEGRTADQTNQGDF